MPKNDQTVVFVRLAEELRSEVENLEKTVFDAGELLGSTDSDSQRRKPKRSRRTTHALRIRWAPSSTRYDNSKPLFLGGSSKRSIRAQECTW